MGITICRPTEEGQHLSKKIDSELIKEQDEQKKKFKILLLGSADSGKSTIVKQMRLLHKGGFNQSELIDAVFQIRSNIVDACAALADAIIKVGVAASQDELALIDVFRLQGNKISLMNESDELQLLMSFTNLPCVSDFLREHRNFPTLPDNFHYFYPELNRILSVDYVPNSMDMVHMRMATQGVHELVFNFNEKTSITLIDVGGQRTERRKWIHFFEGVSAVMFLSSLSSYDQEMEEDIRLVNFSLEKSFRESTPGLGMIIAPVQVSSVAEGIKNRLKDSVELFHSIVKNSYLSRSSFILFLNKMDLFKEKLQKSLISQHFPNFEGSNDFDSAAAFIEKLFSTALLPDDRSLYTHRTQATDTKNIDFVFAAACDIVLQTNMADAGI